MHKFGRKPTFNSITRKFIDYKNPSGLFQFHKYILPTITIFRSKIKNILVPPKGRWKDRIKRLFNFSIVLSLSLPRHLCTDVKVCADTASTERQRLIDLIEIISFIT